MFLAGGGIKKYVDAKALRIKGRSDDDRALFNIREDENQGLISCIRHVYLH
jgi:hypothetical protein